MDFSIQTTLSGSFEHPLAQPISTQIQKNIFETDLIEQPQHGKNFVEIPYEETRVTYEDQDPPQNEIQRIYRDQLSTITTQIDSMLSATAAMRNKIKEHIDNVPIHPYERWRYQYIDPSKPVRTIFDLKFTPTFNPSTATQQISALNEKYYDLSVLQLRSLTATDVEATLNIFANLSGNKFVVDEARMKRHIEFHELVRTIPLTEIENRPFETACKLVNEFIEVYS
jgi:hypothetical protein